MGFLFRHFESLRRSAFVRNSAVLFVGTMVMNVINYLFHLVLGRLASAEVYGEVESLVSLLTIVSVPAAALTLLATKYAAGTKAENHPEGSREIFRLLNRKILTYGALFLLVALLTTPWVREFLKISGNLPVILIWLTMYLAFLGAVTTGILGGWQKFGGMNQVNIWSAFVKFVLMVVLVRAGFGINGVVGSFLLAGLTGYVVSLLGLRFLSRGTAPAGSDPEPVSSVDFAAMKRYVLPVLLGTLAITALGNVEMLFAKHHLSGGDAGAYGALFIVSRVIFFLTGVIASVLFAMSAEENHRKGDSSRTFRYALGLAMVAVVGFVGFYFLFPGFVLGIFFGQKYLFVTRYLGWMAVASGLYSLTYIAFQYLLSTHRTGVVPVLLAVAAIGSVALFSLGGSIYAIINIVIAMQLAALLGCLWFVFRGHDTSRSVSAAPDLPLNTAP